jgi:histidine triad (HIT) family protein
MEDCLFCKIAAGQIPAKIVYQDGQYVAFRDISPQAPTHILVIPRRHIATINDMEPADAQLVGGLFLVAKKLAAEDGVAGEGYRMVLNCNRGAGQSVFHIHLHLLGGRPLQWPPG